MSELPVSSWAVDPTEYHVVKTVTAHKLEEATVAGWKVLGVTHESCVMYGVDEQLCPGPVDAGTLCRHGIAAGGCTAKDSVSVHKVGSEPMFIVGMEKKAWKILDARARLKAGDDEPQQG